MKDGNFLSSLNKCEGEIISMLGSIDLLHRYSLLSMTFLVPFWT